MPKIYTAAPLVLLLDSTTARSHWEMLAQTTVPRNAQSSQTESEEDVNFLCIRRRLRRQLRSKYAPLPELLPPHRSMIIVIVVTDRAKGEYHLSGAEKESVEVSELFDRLNRIYETTVNCIEFVRLFDQI